MQAGMQRTVVPQARVVGTLTLPGDKSITHRALLFGALAQGNTTVHGGLWAEDTRATAEVLRQLGVAIEASPGAPWTIVGRGQAGFSAGPADAPPPILNCGNSGTTLRLLAGVLAARGAAATLVGDASLMRRPMARLVAPLRALGVPIACAPDGHAPVILTARPPVTPLRGAEITLAVASAQVKSAVLLAALGAEGVTVLRGRTDGRDHTERMLRHFGAGLAGEAGVLRLVGPQPLHGTVVDVPGDPSTAAFYWAAAAMAPQGILRTPGVSLNPTRTGLLRVLARMGVNVRVDPEPDVGGEPRGTVTVRGGPLFGCAISPDEVPGLIDELPLVAVLAQGARGRTVVRGAQELRHKESDRLATMAHNLHALGGDVRELPDGFEVAGGRPLHGAVLQSFGDHRVAMASAVAALRAHGASTVTDAGCVAVSCPNFFSALTRLTAPNAAPGDVVNLACPP